MKPQPMTVGMVRRIGATLAALFCLGLSAIALAQGTVVPPNGTLSNDVVDLSVQTSAGPVEWKRTFNGTGWRFNRHWDGISASYKPVMTQNTGGGAPGMSYGSQGGAPATCWIWVDEDWQPGDGLPSVTVPIGGGSGGSTPAPAVPPETYLPPNRSYNQTAAPLDTVITTGFASGCASIGGNLVGNSSEVLEGYRRQSTLYVGAGGTYIFKNRFTLQKQPIQKLAPVALPIGGSVSFVGLTSVASGWRWSDRAGDWAEYDDDGRISRYGDKNNNTVWLQRNAAGQIVRIIDGGTAGVSGNVIITLHYDAKGYLVQAKDWPQASNSLDLAQRTVTYIYDTQGRMTGVTDVRGNTTAYEYDSKQRLTKTTDPRGGETKLTYDAEGTSVKTMTAADGGVTEYGSSWDSTKKLFYSKVTGPATAAGRRVEDYSHDRAGDLVKYEVNGKTYAEIKRDPSIRTETEVNARGFATTSTKNEFEQVTQVDYADGSRISVSYEARLLKPLETTDEVGTKTRFEYDAKGNLTKKTEAAGTPYERVTEYTLDAAGRATLIKRAAHAEVNGAITPEAVLQIAYDAAGLVSQTIDPEGNRRNYTYNRLGRLVKYTDPLANVTSYEVNADGKLTKVTDALGGVARFSYDPMGKLSDATDARGKLLQSQYDAMNRLVKIISPRSGTYKLEYNAAGFPVKETNEDGRSSTLEFDNFLRVSKKADGAGNVTQYGYQIADGSDAGQLGTLSYPTEIKYPTFTEQTKYDALERPTRSTLLNPNSLGVEGLSSGNTFDPRGLIKTTTDAYGKTVSFGYDALARLNEVTDSLGGKVSVVYDNRNNVIQVTDPKGDSTKYTYNRSNQLTAEVLPLGQTTSFAYDATGNLSQRTEPTGARTTFGYDARSRLTEVKRYKSSGQLERTAVLTRDVGGNLTAWTDTDASRPAGQQTTSGTITYDDDENPVSETVNIPNPKGGTLGLTYSYEYSLAGKKTRITWPDGTAIGYSYSAHGELEEVNIPGEGNISVNQFKWTAPTKITLPGGSVQERTYDGLLNLESLKVRTAGQQTTLSLQNTYGKDQELKKQTRTDTSGGSSSTRSASLEYDLADRLVQVKTEAGAFNTDTETFTLDAVGNRVAHSRVTGAWIYDANNRLTQRGSGANAITYQYDDAGNLTQQSGNGRVWRFGYDSSNRLTDVRDGQSQLIARYGYDYRNRRIWKEQYRDAAGAVLAIQKRTYFLYSEEGLLAEATQPITLNADESVSAVVEPVISTQYGVRPDSAFMTGVLFAKTVGSNGSDLVGYFHHDQLEAPVQATSKDGSVVWAANFNIFGQANITTPVETAERPTMLSNLRLPGQYFDEETGLHYNYRRFYDPITGRYIQSDPLGLQGGLNRFAYGDANPANVIDPMGLSGDGFKLTDPSTWPTIPDEILTPIVGFGDGLLSGLTLGLWDGTAVRDWMGISSPDPMSCAYQNAKLAGELTVMLLTMRARPNPCNSFTADTLVHVRPPDTGGGAAVLGKSYLKPIAALEVGDEVLAASDWKDRGIAEGQDQRLSYEKVVDVYTSFKQQTLITLRLASGEVIETTEGHPFKTTEGWRDAILLKRGGQLLLGGEGRSDLDGNTGERTVEITEVIAANKVVPVFNLEVANAHTFFVGRDGALVHNSACSNAAARAKNAAAQKPQKGYHGNDRRNSDPQHNYDILNSKGEVRKTGVGTGEAKDGVSARAEGQLQPGDTYRIRDSHPAGPGARGKAYEREKELAKEHLDANEPMDRHVRPRPK